MISPWLSSEPPEDQRGTLDEMVNVALLFFGGVCGMAQSQENDRTASIYHCFRSFQSFLMFFFNDILPTSICFDGGCYVYLGVQGVVGYSTKVSPSHELLNLENIQDELSDAMGKDLNRWS